MPENADTIDVSMERAVAAAAKENYLGDPVVVQGLLRTLASNCLNRFDFESPKESADKDIEDCKAMADVFLGKSKDYAPMKDWNKPGQITAFVADHSEVAGSTPEEIMASVFVSFLIDIYSLYNYAVGGALDENWTWQVDAICEQYTNLLLGVQESDVTEADLDARTE